jgi:hypothetical protein
LPIATGPPGGSATQRPFNQETYPNAGTISADGTLASSLLNVGGTVTWLSTWAIPGFVTAEAPPGGDYVPSGVAGLNYVSPGYL